MSKIGADPNDTDLTLHPEYLAIADHRLGWITSFHKKLILRKYSQTLK